MSFTEILFNAALVYSLAEQWPTAMVYIEKGLDKGLSSVWFDLPWFDALCRDELIAMTELLGPERCKIIPD